MKTVKLAYSDLYNAGDLMNVDIVEKVGNCKVARSKTFCAEMTAIGGALVGLQYSGKLYERVIQHALKLIYSSQPIYIWGSGFLYDFNNRGLYRKNLKVCALRGAKTRQKLEKLTGQKYDVPLADAGLLIDMLMDQMPEKKYKLGLIPHMWHQEEPAMARMAQMDGVHLIDIKQTPQQVGAEIAACETIASTSLHGLIFADALHIPNLHIRGEKELRGGNFKFEDYYSSFGLEDKPYALSEHIPTADEIIASYRIDADAVEKKKKELVACFPKFDD
ncbi:polysaccharide pyruvyl transferase family protein [Ruminococcus sp.]|uniref:polysaccharide pyruvyl transferase family protein n=1 Tax=Ruminococcus sp. TaxID=41978 RepID=UPI002E80FA9A|nr:polysaccharide pyruvyl transferase family protein [Ruminococcus sp.]MEE3491936.1 polysaccharide pyruvyl transferase family protein [Ruminococcus sp.]